MTTATAYVDLSAVAHNVSVFRDLVGSAAVCAVVKADGYGHGANEVARAAVEAGASWLAVATVAEAAELAGVVDRHDVPILVLSERPESELRGRWADLPPTTRLVIASEAGARLIDSLATRPVPVHLKVDTGMHRMGIEPSSAVALADLVAELPRLTLEGVCTHLAVADEPANPFTITQIRRFDEVLVELKVAGHHPAIIHVANSAAAMTRPETHHDMIRLGIAMYGVAPSRGLNAVADLRPVLRLVAEVAAVRTVDAGESVSYGRRWFADAPTRIATLAIGYADGIRRSSARAGVEVLIGGQRCPMVGVVTMDQTTVAVDDTVVVGDEVVLIGDQGSESITAAEVADRLDTIGYEVLVALGPRIARRATR